MNDHPIYDREIENDSIVTLIRKILSSTDMKIIRAIDRIQNRHKKSPTASEILAELMKSESLKKTQLYERLNRLTKLGFISMSMLPRPRTYLLDTKTISQGVHKWIDNQIVSIENLTSEIESFRELIKKIKPSMIVSVMTDNLLLENKSDIR